MVTHPCLGSNLAGEVAPTLPFLGRDLAMALMMIWSDWNLGVDGMTARDRERRGGGHVSLATFLTGQPTPEMLAPHGELPCTHCVLARVVGVGIPLDSSFLVALL